MVIAKALRQELYTALENRFPTSSQLLIVCVLLDPTRFKATKSQALRVTVEAIETAKRAIVLEMEEIEIAKKGMMNNARSKMTLTALNDVLRRSRASTTQLTQGRSSWAQWASGTGPSTAASMSKQKRVHVNSRDTKARCKRALPMTQLPGGNFVLQLTQSFRDLLAYVIMSHSYH